MPSPEWYYDELRQVGVDFADAAEVAAYDRNQRTVRMRFMRISAA